MEFLQPRKERIFTNRERLRLRISLSVSFMFIRKIRGEGWPVWDAGRIISTALTEQRPPGWGAEGQ